jgi:murein L,D-transpeptidase YcbB/YkuD
LLICFINLTNCAEKKDPIQISEQIKSTLPPVSKAIADNLSKYDKSNVVSKIYVKNGFKSYWIDENDFQSHTVNFIELLLDPLALGFEAEPNASSIQNSMRKLASDTVAFLSKAIGLEFELTEQFLQMAKKLNYGLLDSVRTTFYDNAVYRKSDFSEDLIALENPSKIKELLLSFQPNNLQYELLQSNLSDWLKTIEISEDAVDVPAYHVDSALSLDNAKFAMIQLGFTDSVDAKDPVLFEEVVKRFQSMNGLKPDGVIGNNTALAMSMSTKTLYRKAAANLERWKWRSDWEGEYIYINIPTFELQYISNRKVIKNHNIIVGNPKAATPEFNDSIEYIIVYPYWNVPFSIATKELIPKMKRDSTLFERNKFELVYGRDSVVTHHDKPWHKYNKRYFPYRIRQKGGGSNSLGQIKFIFPNKHMVYLHDTPTKKLFSNEIRTYSHGCLRLQDPIDFAAFILERDSNEMTKDSINYYIKNEERKQINLKKKVPIRIHYFTTEGDELGNLQFNPDPYSKDDELIELIFDKPSLAKRD